jgi:DAK2 domain fusion protein YloV
METLERLGADNLREVFCAYRDALRIHQDRLNRLNVYPVPDGDTGTNMALTLESVVAEMASVEPGNLPALAAALRHGSLMGARGNSGVILSQILRGVADAVADASSMDAGVLTRALQGGREGAYAAVHKPVEGTILTVATGAADAAQHTAARGGSLLEVTQAAHQGAAEALARTPELLPVLARAGVVDAGGSGLLLFFDALLKVITGRPLPESPPPPHDQGELSPARGGAQGYVGDDNSADDDSADEDSAKLAGLRYEVMFFLQAEDDSVAAFRQAWSGIGDSIVVVGGDGLFNCHIHTDDIGGAIEAALAVGRPRGIRVTDLLDQVAEERWVSGALATCPAPPEAGEDDETPGEPAVTAVVAVATGAGIEKIFRSLGVRRIVPGGQSMNPSTAELLAALDSVEEAEVILLPNNSNVVAVAEQASAVSPKRVRVVPTRDVAEGFAALMDYDPQSGAEANLAAMSTSAGRVVSAQVTRAVRASGSVAGPIESGDWLGLTRAGIVVVAPTIVEATCRLLALLVTPTHEIVTIIEGDRVPEGASESIDAWAKDNLEASVELLQGGQPIYPYLLSIE